LCIFAKFTQNLAIFTVFLLGNTEKTRNLAESYGILPFFKKTSRRKQVFSAANRGFYWFLVHIANFHEKKNLLVWQHTKWKCYFSHSHPSNKAKKPYKQLKDFIKLATTSIFIISQKKNSQKKVMHKMTDLTTNNRKHSMMQPTTIKTTLPWLLCIN